MIQQKTVILKPYSRGFHLVTSEIVEKLGKLPKTGLLNLFLCHTSAGLTLNENADPTVREDFETVFNEIAREDHPNYRHTMEGKDDMPAHIKSTLTGVSLTIPISNGELACGIWQGIYLCEFRNWGGNRKIIATIYS